MREFRFKEIMDVSDLWSRSSWVVKVLKKWKNDDVLYPACRPFDDV